MSRLIAQGRERARRRRVLATGAEIIADALDETTTTEPTPDLRVVRTRENLRPVSPTERAPRWRTCVAIGSLAVTFMAMVGVALHLRDDQPTC